MKASIPSFGINRCPRGLREHCKAARHGDFLRAVRGIADHSAANSRGPGSRVSHRCADVDRIQVAEEHDAYGCRSRPKSGCQRQRVMYAPPASSATLEAGKRARQLWVIVPESAVAASPIAHAIAATGNSCATNHIHMETATRSTTSMGAAICWGADNLPMVTNVLDDLFLKRILVFPKAFSRAICGISYHAAPKSNRLRSALRASLVPSIRPSR